MSLSDAGFVLLLSGTTILGNPKGLLRLIKAFPKGNSSSNHYFSGAMLNFGGVSGQNHLTWFEVCCLGLLFEETGAETAKEAEEVESAVPEALVVFCGHLRSPCSVLFGFKCGYGSFQKKGGTPKWMVKIMENPIKMDDLGVPLFSETSKCGYYWRGCFFSFFLVLVEFVASILHVKLKRPQMGYGIY